MPKIHNDALVPCPLCAGECYLSESAYASELCPLCQGRGMLHEEFVALCRSGFASDAPDGLDIEWGCDECGRNEIKGLVEHMGGHDNVICYDCYCQRQGIALPVYEASEAEPF